ncbi:hypothetical protein, partial [Acinetobacter sp. YH12102]|uniref:hypothetical protein n=1 Tax=Acinetobacter sp. YH12102 TaxID=2601091 RepID=UPI001C5508F5
KFFIRHRHQHIKPSANEIAKVHILKADIFTLEKPDISILELQTKFRITAIMLNGGLRNLESFVYEQNKFWLK